MSKTGMLDMLQSDSRSPKRFKVERAKLKRGCKFFWSKPEPPRPRRKSKSKKRR